MIRRSFNIRFREAILAGTKITTIREKPWPVGKPIMAFNWSGLPYRSKQVEIAPIVCMGFWTITIAHRWDGSMQYRYGMENDRELFETEGFDSQDEMDAWFRPLVKEGQTVAKTLMRFRVANEFTTDFPISA